MVTPLIQAIFDFANKLTRIDYSLVGLHGEVGNHHI
jgi:hypothetical protein